MFTTLFEKLSRAFKKDLIMKLVSVRRREKELKKQLKQMRRNRNFYYCALVSIAERRTTDPIGHARSIIDHGKKSKTQGA